MNDPGNEKIRGYSDIPLSYEGKKGIEATAQFLKDGKFPIVHILSSPLQRAMMTSQLVAGDRARVIPHQGLLPWNLGRYTEQPVKEVADKMNHLQSMPDLKAPEGESYRSFYERWGDTLDRMLEFVTKESDEILVGVVHSRNLLALPSILGNKEIGDVPVKGGPDPGAVVEISKKPGGEWEIKTIWEGTK